MMHPPGQLVTQFSKDSLDKWKNNNEKPATGEGGTVGAVAIDKYGNIAAATSTGGLTGKLPGRVGDTPIIGAGTYADNLIGGISATGDGDTIMKVPLVYDILKRMEYLGDDMTKAAEDALDAMTERLGGTAGIIGLDKQGNVAIVCNTEQISWAYQRGNTLAYGVRKGEHIEEQLTFEQMSEEILEQMFAEYN